MNEHVSHADFHLNQWMETIFKEGWSFQSVTPNTPEDLHAVFSFTAGLTAMEHPELVIIGLTPLMAYGMVKKLVTQVQQGRRLVPGEEFTDVANIPLRTVPVLVKESYYLGGVRAIYGDKVTGLQLVYPDRFGVWPWEPDHDIVCEVRQCVLGPWEGTTS